MPNDTAALAAARDYLRPSVPILKQIAALGSQRASIGNAAVYINGAAVARAFDVDDKGRPLTAWAHCRVLGKDELLLLNLTNPGSLDSRYFGPIDASLVRGRAIPVWTTEQQ